MPDIDFSVVAPRSALVAQPDGYRVESERDVALLLQELVDQATPIQINSPTGASLGTVMWAVDTDRDCLSFRAHLDSPQLHTLVEGDEATAVAYLHQVKLQFDLQDMVLLRGLQKSVIQSRIPRQVYRFQRRETFRVRTIAHTTPTAELRHPAIPDMSLSLRVLDMSFGGCALLLPHDVPLIEPGCTLHGVRMSLNSDTRFIASLVLQHVSSLQAPELGLRLGCELASLDGNAERALQRYVDQTQKRRRLLSLD